ncbi:MAG: glycosyltransferase family 4 protein [Candidatus Saccharimonadaceae bacterium]
MKVLWFSNTPSLAAEILHDQSNLRGWVSSLEKELIKVEGIELGVVFTYGFEGKKHFKIGTTNYYSVPYAHTKGRIRGIFSRWKHNIEPAGDINYYLEIVEEFKPDVIHIFGTEYAFGLIIEKVKVPIIIQIQGNLSVCEKKWFSGLSNCNILRHSNPKVIIQAYGLWHLYFLFSKRASRERKLMQFCKYFIGRTDWDRRISHVLSPGRKYYHCEELLRDEFYQADLWQKPVKTNIKFVSTVSPMVYKGLETILETSKLLSDMNLCDFEWNIVGVKGNEEIISIIEKTYGLRFAEQNIYFKGSMNSNKLIVELSQAQIYVHPSHIENSPNSVCEAMLLGIPIIATYAGGTPSIIANGVEGLLVQDGDPFSLAGAISELIQDKNLMLFLGSNAHNKAIVRHDRKQVSERIVAIYKEVIKDNSNELS